MNTQKPEIKKAQDTIKLVEGTYTPAEAADILFSLIGDKIKFHNLQMLSLQERFGIDSVHSEQRIQELKASKMQVKDLILQARDAGCTLRIQGDIKISLLPQDQ